MSVRAKFQCESVTAYQGGKTAKLRAVYSDNGENANFTKYTPNGELSITITDEAPAASFFEPGKSYYLTFDEAPAE